MRGVHLGPRKNMRGVTFEPQKKNGVWVQSLKHFGNDSSVSKGDAAVFFLYQSRQKNFHQCAPKPGLCHTVHPQDCHPVECTPKVVFEACMPRQHEWRAGKGHG